MESRRWRGGLVFWVVFGYSITIIFNIYISFKNTIIAFEFFNLINLFYGSITDFCSSQTCPCMSAGPG